MTIDPEDKSPSSLAKVAEAAQVAGIADEGAAYENAIATSEPETADAASLPVDDGSTEESGAHPS